MLLVACVFITVIPIRHMVHALLLLLLQLLKLIDSVVVHELVCGLRSGAGAESERYIVTVHSYRSVDVWI
jgi:hypothetical protein